MTENAEFAVFFPVWIGLALITWAVFSTGSYETKRKWAQRLVILAGVLFLSFFYWATGSTKNVIFPAVVVLITVINLRAIQFCPKCAAFQRNGNPMSKARYCSKCGHDLQEPKSDV